MAKRRKKRSGKTRVKGHIRKVGRKRIRVKGYLRKK